MVMFVDQSDSKWVKGYRWLVYSSPVSIPIYVSFFLNDLSLEGVGLLLGASTLVAVMLYLANRTIIQSLFIKGPAYLVSLVLTSAWVLTCLIGVLAALFALDESIAGMVFLLSVGNAFVQTSAIVYPPRDLQKVEEDENLLDEEFWK
ncbi:hypothetical protein GCM10011318_04190 [Phaeocystidibacter marisrubri]|nr:hypothetical protein GCM10011318_04190 [Phaeocystidibacter marisrubri]